VRRSSRAAIALTLVLAVAAFVRVWNLDWSLPSLTEEAAPVHEAIEMWGFESGEPSLDPETVGWPALSFYVQRGLQQADFFLGDFGDPLDYYVAWRLDPTGPVMLARWTAVVCMLGVVLIAFLVGRRLAGMPGAITAAALCALSPLMVRHSQLVEPDALVAVFSGLALVWLLKVSRRGSIADYLWCGVWIGLGMASKYTPALLGLSLLAVHVDRLRTEGNLRLLGLVDRRIWLAALAVLGAFLVTNPYFLGDLDVLRRDLGYQATHMSAGHFGHTEHGLGYVRYLGGVLPGALGLLGFVAGVLGLAFGYGDRNTRVIMYYLLPWLLVLGAFSTSFDRYMLPVVLPLALGAGLFIARARGPALVGLAIAVVLAQPALATWAYQQSQSAEDTRDLARRWVVENVDHDTQTIALEYHGPDLAFGTEERVAEEPVFDRLSEAQRSRLLAAERYRAVRIPRIDRVLLRSGPLPGL
jgi:4-amino-4-deoxy-L-arabinose transferase-like glycosyltransferase